MRNKVRTHSVVSKSQSTYNSSRIRRAFDIKVPRWPIFPGHTAPQSWHHSPHLHGMALDSTHSPALDEHLRAYNISNHDHDHTRR